MLFCHLILSDLHQQLTKITARSFTENQTPPSSCSERKVIIQFGNLIRVSLAKHGFRGSRVGFSKWSKHGQTTLLVAGHDPPIDITIYSDVPTNPGPQFGNSIESFLTNSDKRKPKDRSRHYSNLGQVPLTAPAIVYNNRPRLIRCCVLNAQSIRNKGPDLVDFVCDSKVDIVVITETWLKSGDSAARIAATPSGYPLFDHPRPDRNGGGTGILAWNSFVVKQARAGICDTFEYSEWIIVSGSARLRLVVIYRPPYSSSHPRTVGMFVTEFAEFLESVVMTAEPLVLAGDFNINVNSMTDNDAAQFLDLLSSMGLNQHIDFPTHTSGNTLDLLISRTLNSNLIQDVRPGTYFSDHCLALFTINISVPQLSRKKVSFRKTKAIDITAFMEDLSASRLGQDPPSEPVKLVDCYNTTLAGLLDRRALLKTKTVTVRPQVPWYSEEIREAKRARRRAERKWRTTRSVADFVSFKRHKNNVTHLLKEGKSAFLTDFISQNSDNQGKLFRAVKNLLVKTKSLCFSDYTDKSALANDIGKYFVQKISRLREELDQGYAPNDQSYVLDDSDVNSDSTIPPTRIEAFELLAEDDVRVLIANSRSTSCCLDPIPTHLLKSCSDSLIPVITNIINSSLESGIFPDCWKEAVVIPLLKKPGLESLFKNLRPVINLAYISKLTERAVFNQIYDHLVRSGLYPQLQSPYHRYHSTETALIEVANDILLNMSSQRVTLLVLLDLSAAFDTVDHAILLRTLDH